MTFLDVLPHLIWTGVLGLAVGNYATSWIYRMPLGESPFTKHPYCGGCGTMLGVKDLIPGVSYPLLGGECRYCSMDIPAIYWWTELFCALIFMWGIISYGWSEPYLLVALGGTVAVVLWGLEMRSGRIFADALLFLASIGLVFRVLQDDTVYDALFGVIWGASIPLVWWRMTADPQNLTGEKERLHMPPAASLGATAGVWLAPFGLLLFVPLWGLLALAYPHFARRIADWPERSLSVPFCVALMLLVLNPGWIEAAKAAATNWLLP